MNNNLILEPKCIKKIIKIYIASAELTLEDVDEFYFEGIDGVKKIDLDKNIKKDVKEKLKKNIKKFLFKWGNMGRVLGRDKFSKWEDKIVKGIRYHSNKLKCFSKKDLARDDIDDLRDDIIECYDNFRSVIKQVAASKVLHLICPDFFPPWDNAIRNAILSEVKKENKNGKRIKSFSGDEYYTFMKVVQKFIKRYKRFLSIQPKKMDMNEH